jgi:hypothetical protein
MPEMQPNTWQTVYVFGQGFIDSVHQPEQLQQTLLHKEDKAEARKQRERARCKEWRLQNLERYKAKKKVYDAKNRDHILARQKEYTAKNRDKIKAQKKESYARNKDHHLAFMKEYTAKNRDKIKAHKQEYAAKNRDKIKAHKQEFYAKNRDRVLAVNKAYAVKNRDKIKAITKAYRQQKLGCIECKEWPVDWRQGWPHYDGYCFRCFCDKFKDDERVKTRGRVELRVRSYLDSHFPDFVHDQPIHTAHCVCSHRRRVDHRRLIGNTLLCVETDENFHRYYDPDDEEARYHDVIMAWGGKLCFVRFNPHKFNLDDRYDHGPPLEERLQRLRAEVIRHIGRLERGENTSYLEVHHLYYPAGTPDYYEEESCTQSTLVL